IICGDDLETAHAGREDLQGGVERAVRELLPGFAAIDNFWYWQKQGPNSVAAKLKYGFKRMAYQLAPRWAAEYDERRCLTKRAQELTAALSKCPDAGDLVATLESVRDFPAAQRQSELRQLLDAVRPL